VNNLVDILIIKVCGIIDVFRNYLKLSPISSTFIFILFIVFCLNFVKAFLIWRERKQGDQSQSCKYLIKKEDEHHYCSIRRRQKKFIENGCSCSGCKGKTFCMTNIEAEERAAAGAVWKKVVIQVANGSKNLLPYISFLYTLVLAIFELQNT